MESHKIAFIFFLALAVVFGGYNLGRALLGPKQGEDFAQYYVAARLILEGSPNRIYETGESYQESAAAFGVSGVKIDGESREVMTYAYPPFAAIIMVPFSMLPYDTARYLFFFLSLAATLAAVPLLFADRRGARRRELILVGTAAVILFFPHHYSLYMGQINSLLFLGSVLSLYWIRRNRSLSAGFFLALAGVIKIFPLVLLLAFLTARKYRAVLATLGGTILLIVVTAILCGIEPWRMFIQEVLPEQYSGGAWVRNQGFHGFFSRLLVTNDFVGSFGDHPFAARVLSTTFAVAALAAAATVAARRPSPVHPLRIDLVFGLLFTTALLALAKSWEHYGIFLLPSYLFLYEWLRFESGNGVKTAFALLLSFSVWAFILTAGTDYAALPTHPLANLIFSAKFFATLTLFVCNAAVLRRSCDWTDNSSIHG